jgi:hypothetical protein
MPKPFNEEAEYYNRKYMQDAANNEQDDYNNELQRQNLNSGMNIDNPSQTSAINKHNYAKQAQYLQALAASRSMQTQLQNASLATQNALADSATQRKINRLQTMNTLASGRVDRSIAKKSLEQQRYQFEVQSNLQARQQALNRAFQQHSLSKEDFLMRTKANMDAAGMMFDMTKFKAAEQAARNLESQEDQDRARKSLLEAVGLGGKSDDTAKNSQRAAMISHLGNMATQGHQSSMSSIALGNPLMNLFLSGLGNAAGLGMAQQGVGS